MNTRVALIRIAAKNERRVSARVADYFFCERRIRLGARDDPSSFSAASRRSRRRIDQRAAELKPARRRPAPARPLGTPAGAMSTYVYVDGEDASARGRAGGRMAVQRRTVDYTATTVRHVEVRARARWRSRARKATSRQTIPRRAREPRPLPRATEFPPPLFRVAVARVPERSLG